MAVTPQPTSFNLSEKLLDIKNSKGQVNKYLPVQWRLVWFREVCKEGKIKTELIHLDLDREITIDEPIWENRKIVGYKPKTAAGIAIFRAEITTPEGGGSTGHKKEDAVNFYDFVEKAETGAIGRALAAIGYGTQFSDEEYLEGERLADAPVATQKNTDRQNKPTGQQIQKIKELAKSLKKSAPWANTPEEADQVIRQLEQELNSSKEAPPNPPPQAQQTGEEKPITLPQMKAIKNICQLQQLKEPKNLSSMTEKEAGDFILQLKKKA